MVITIDFDNETVTSEQGTINTTGIKDKQAEVLKLLGLELISGEELKDDIKGLFNELGLDNITV